MANEDDGFVDVTLDHHSQHIGGARHDVLQGFTCGKADEMRCGKPGGEQLLVSQLGLLVVHPLPCAVIDVVQRIECLCLDLA
jgi:hypothetical protein